jgi:hypothetical protein
MSTVDWKKWSDNWSAPQPKNQMWNSVRTGANDPGTGEPLKYTGSATHATADKAVSDLMQEHRLTVPGAAGSQQVCFAGDYTGTDHAGHLAEIIDAYLNPE